MHMCFLKFITGFPRAGQDHSWDAPGSGCLHSFAALNGQLIQGDLWGTRFTVLTPNLPPEGDENRKDRTSLEGKILFYLDCHFRKSNVSVYT